MDLERSRPSRFWRGLLLVASVLCSLAGLLFAALYYHLYWRYRDLFNEQGRYFDPVEMVVYDDSAFVFIVPAITLLGLALFTAWGWWKTR